MLEITPSSKPSSFDTAIGQLPSEKTSTRSPCSGAAEPVLDSKGNSTSSFSARASPVLTATRRGAVDYARSSLARRSRLLVAVIPPVELCYPHAYPGVGDPINPCSSLPSKEIANVAFHHVAH